MLLTEDAWHPYYTVGIHNAIGVKWVSSTLGRTMAGNLIKFPLRSKNQAL